MCTNEINILINDIKQIATDYLKYFKTDRKKTLEDTTYYVYEILYNIYDKKIIKKYMYIEILEQLICNLFPYLNYIFIKSILILLRVNSPFIVCHLFD